MKWSRKWRQLFGRIDRTERSWIRNESLKMR
jgi:hypothetical protein